VVRDELTSGLLVEAARLEGISEHFLAVTRERRFPNPLIAELLGPQVTRAEESRRASP
jgi:LysR family transcriptional activator of nhaA